MQLNAGSLANNWQIEVDQHSAYRVAVTALVLFELRDGRRSDWLQGTLQCRSHSSPKLRENDESGMGSDSLVVGDSAARRARRLGVWSG